MEQGGIPNGAAGFVAKVIVTRAVDHPHLGFVRVLFGQAFAEMGGNDFIPFGENQGEGKVEMAQGAFRIPVFSKNPADGQPGEMVAGHIFQLVHRGDEQQTAHLGGPGGGGVGGDNAAEGFARDHHGSTGGGEPVIKCPECRIGDGSLGRRACSCPVTGILKNGHGAHAGDGAEPPDHGAAVERMARIAVKDKHRGTRLRNGGGAAPTDRSVLSGNKPGFYPAGGGCRMKRGG